MTLTSRAICGAWPLLHRRTPRNSCAFMLLSFIEWAMSLKAGDPAPAIQLSTSEGEPFALSSLQGRDVILFFYPKADTPG